MTTAAAMTAVVMMAATTVEVMTHRKSRKRTQFQLTNFPLEERTPKQVNLSMENELSHYAQSYLRLD